MALPFDPADFLIPSGVTHVRAGGKTPALRTLGEALALADNEYPSLAAPFAMRPEVTLRVAEGCGGLPGVISPRTRVIAASSVSFLNGECADLARLRALADSVGALLVLDHTQAAGWMPIEAGVADFSSPHATSGCSA